MRIFIAYRDAPERRAALTAGGPERYRLFGLDELAARGAEIHHNLERRIPRWARAADWLLDKVIYGIGGYGGDFASVLASLREINRAEVVLSTVDTVGLPLVLLKRFGLVRPPIVYVAVGLPERLVQLRRHERLYRRALTGTRAIVSYAESEVRWLRHWLGGRANVVFVPFGVDTAHFTPVENRPEVDVLSVGADPRRDFLLLMGIAARHPELTFPV